MLTSAKAAHEAADEMIRSDSDSAETTAMVESLIYVAHVLQTQHAIQYDHGKE